MRKVDILDDPNHELTSDDFINLIRPAFEDGKVCGFYGSDPYDRSKTLVVFETWIDLATGLAVVNGWEGGEICDSPLYGDQNLISKINELEKEIEEAEKEGKQGLLWNYKKKYKQLLNRSAYLRWLHENDFEEKSFDDFDIETGFSDEYSYCCNCYNNIVRTQADSYDWTAPLFIDCEGYACEECVKAGEFDEYVLEEYKNEQKSIPEEFDISRLGLVQINDRSYKNGMHCGMDDSPEPIIEQLNEQDVDVWFKVYSSQFHCEFDVYVKEEDEEKAKQILEGVDTYQGFSTAGNCEKALKEASAKMSELPDNSGIKYAKCNPDGTADVRLVSEEEFVKGIKD